MRFSLSTALALCVSSALAASADGSSPIADVTVVSTNGQADSSSPRDSECVSYPLPTVPVKKISISNPAVPDVRCTFYKGADCQGGEGNEYTLRAGPHNFSRDFYVTSYKCYKPT
ncbi:hypothetical protein BDV59DRAFT_197776 [Aspergillus ambiguus]|uniref:uncharacterized protein n=1 Tax=Aspergillus ambiguus TaxID=176160 RepID=UPI003CCD4DF8